MLAAPPTLWSAAGLGAPAAGGSGSPAISPGCSVNLSPALSGSSLHQMLRPGVAAGSTAATSSTAMPVASPGSSVAWAATAAPLQAPAAVSTQALASPHVGPSVSIGGASGTSTPSPTVTAFPAPPASVATGSRTPTNGGARTPPPNLSAVQGTPLAQHQLHHRMQQHAVLQQPFQHHPQHQMPPTNQQTMRPVVHIPGAATPPVVPAPKRSAVTQELRAVLLEYSRGVSGWQQEQLQQQQSTVASPSSTAASPSLGKAVERLQAQQRRLASELADLPRGGGDCQSDRAAALASMPVQFVCPRRRNELYGMEQFRQLSAYPRQPSTASSSRARSPSPPSPTEVRAVPKAGRSSPPSPIDVQTAPGVGRSNSPPLAPAQIEMLEPASGRVHFGASAEGAVSPTLALSALPRRDLDCGAAEASAGVVASLEATPEACDRWDASLKSCVLRRGLSQSPRACCSNGISSPAAQEAEKFGVTTLDRLKAHFEAQQQFAKQKAWEAKAALAPSMGTGGCATDLAATPPNGPFTPRSLASSANTGSGKWTTTVLPSCNPVHHMLAENGDAEHTCDSGQNSDGGGCEDDGVEFSRERLEMRLAQVLQRLGNQVYILEEILAHAESSSANEATGAATDSAPRSSSAF